jgi:hypothetical protein
MAIITDPDNLDRWQVLVDYVDQKIGIKPILSDDNKVDPHTDGIATSGTSFFTSAGANFTSSGVAVGDILTIAEGRNIDHWTVTGVTVGDEIGVNGTFYAYDAATETNLSFSVTKPTGGTVTDGATMQAIYSFLKEEWLTQGESLPDLIKHTFPLESITREQFEIGGSSHENWDWRDDDTRNLIRTGGWAQVNSAGTTQKEFAGIITLGSLDTDAQVYYLQSATGIPYNFVLTGGVNQAIEVYENGGDDKRGFLSLYVRKKGKSYAQSKIADIGVTTIETIVNRFPLAHVDDPAITASDGDLAGTSPYQSVAEVGGDTDGYTVSSTASAVEKTWVFGDADATFQTDALQAKDILYIRETANTGKYEIVSVDSETGLTLLQEPTVAITTDTNVDYVTYTRVRSSGSDDAEFRDLATDSISSTGYLTSANSTFTTDSVAANDVLVISTGTNAYVGAYQVISAPSETGLYVNTFDQVWPTAPETSQTFQIYRPGMFLQFQNTTGAEVTSASATNIDFLDTDPDTIVRDDGNFVTDGFTAGMAIGVSNAGSGANNTSFIVDTVATGTLTLIAAESVAHAVDDTNAVIHSTGGFVRTMNAVDYPFSWRLLGNDGTLGQCFQFIQKELRRTTDIDQSELTQRGDITDVLMSYASPTATTEDMFIDDLNAADFNNATKKDITGDSRNFAFIAGLTINLNQNILDASVAKVTIFFTNDDDGDDNGYDFGTDDAIIVDKADGTDMTESNPSSSPLSWTFDYDNNVQRGAASAGTDAPITIVAIGTNYAQYVQVSDTILRQSTNVYSLVSALERNYQNA